jgi:hypothetical protein
MLILVKLSSQEVSQVQFQKKGYNLSNSHWTFKVENCCLNYYDLKEYHSYIFYSGERDEYYPGVYSIKNDTLFLREFYSYEDDPFELLDKEVKFVALLNGNSFQLLYREDQIRTKEGYIKWVKTLLDEKPIFRRTNKLSNKTKLKNK